MSEHFELALHVITKTDWALLRQQKASLNIAIEHYSLYDNYNSLTQDLIGLQNFLDSLQDKVVELNLVDKETVFGKEG